MRIYKVKDDGSLKVISSINKTAGRVTTTYQIATAVTRDENGNPVDVAVSVTCPTGQHADITDEEKAKFGQVDSWESVTLAATEYVKKMVSGANVHMTESRPFGGPSNREEYRVAPEVVTVPSGGIQRLRERKKQREEQNQEQEQTSDINYDTTKSDEGEKDVQF